MLSVIMGNRSLVCVRELQAPIWSPGLICRCQDSTGRPAVRTDNCFQGIHGHESRDALGEWKLYDAFRTSVLGYLVNSLSAQRWQGGGGQDDNRSAFLFAIRRMILTKLSFMISGYSLVCPGTPQSCCKHTGNGGSYHRR